MIIFLFAFTLYFISCNETGKAYKNIESTNEISKIKGDTVSQLSNNIMVIYQDKKNN